ncbi:Serpin-Z2A [Bienertia sinuspersici]
MRKLATISSANSSSFLSFARILPALPLFRCSSKIQENYNAKFYRNFSTNAIEQQQCDYTRNYTTGLPSISCKDLSKKPKQDFSFSVAKHFLLDCLNKTPRMNLLCSPVSTSAILNMLIPGSKGETLDQFVELLGLKEEKLNKSSLRLLDVVKPFEGGNRPKVSFSNSVWVDQQHPLTQSYKEVLDGVHGAEVKSVDFMSKEINLWSRTKTEGMIKTILPETSYYNDTVMVLANALHVNFERSDETMDHVEAQCSLYYCGNYEGSEVLRMPFKQGKNVSEQDPRTFSMYIFVPSEKTDHVKKQNTSLSDYIQEMKVDAKAFQKKISRQKEEISDIVIPNFNIGNEISLSNIMQHLGLTLPFKGGQNELMKFVDSPFSDLLYVTDITQKNQIVTNKKGTSFSVVTYTTLNGPPHRLPPTPPKLKFEDLSGVVVSIGTMLSLILPFKGGQNELIKFVDSPFSVLLSVTDITQKNQIVTNKKGTSFSVVTYTTLNGPPHRLPPTPPKLKFVADNPFLFMIQEDLSGAVVSIGTMLSTSLSS